MPAIRLSVNVNKVATVRNSRGGREPDVLEAVRACLHAGAPGITVHPRADRRHITPEDVRAIAAELAAWRRGVEAADLRAQPGGPHSGPAGGTERAAKGERVPRAGVRGGAPTEIELNIEGDPRPELLALVHEVRPDQCTLVPVAPGEITSQAGWAPATRRPDLPEIIQDLQGAGIRVSVFVDAEAEPIEWAASVGADRIELYTEPFARAFEEGAAAAERSFARYVEAATLAHARGLGVNAGHDLDLHNLVLFRQLPHLDEVSIGHALISRAIFVGLEPVVREYLDVLAAAPSAAR
ncbi:MAG: pyridoxine 5'-phosphate synthase [Acidobacteriota bacterium]|nr:pyridoxine 5'-phosphate synthase [Acidobacteriota bacterium]